MVKELFNNNTIIYIMCGLFGIGVLLKFVLSRIYSSLIKASENMGSSKNKLTQVMKLKFETFYKLKIGVNNVDIFVDKYVYHHKFCGILLSTWENICGQVLIICLLVGSVGSILGLIYECGKIQILSVFSVGIVSSGLLIIFDGILNLSGKKELMRLNMKDYLENFLKVRLEQQLLSPETIEQYKKEYLEKEEIKPKTLNPSMVMGSADNHYIMVEKSESMDKPLSRKEKRASKKERKELARKEAAEIREAVRLEKERRKKEAKERKVLLKLEKKQSKIDKKEEAKEIRLEAQRMKELEKEEAKLALEHKRAEERAEIERNREELKKADERRREEKIRQQEIQKALLLEKRATKKDKKNNGNEQKTIAQERKENLLREVQERREKENTVKMLDLEEELESSHNKDSNEKEVILSKQENFDNVQEVAPVLNDEIKNIEEAPKEYFNVLTAAESKNESKTSKAYQNKTQTKGSNSKKRKSPDQLEDKLIEDILKEFLA